jgi:hypothetical protein
MNLVLEKAARKGLDRMTSKTAGAMLERLEAVAAAPDPKHTNVKPLSGARCVPVAPGKLAGRVRAGSS